MLQGMADALRAEPDRVAELAATGIRCLVVHGAADDAWPPAVQAEMAERLGAAHTVLDAAGALARGRGPAGDGRGAAGLLVAAVRAPSRGILKS